jgi:hypothetical protein
VGLGDKDTGSNLLAFSPDARLFLMAGTHLVSDLHEDLLPEFRGGIGQYTVDEARIWELADATLPAEAEAVPLPGAAERIVCWLQAATGVELVGLDTYPASVNPAFATVVLLSADDWRQRRQRLAELGGPPP